MSSAKKIGLRTGQIISWLRTRDSGFWLSVFSAMLSFVTFYLVYLRRAHLEVHIPNEVGIQVAYKDSSILLLAPTVFYNPGAERSHCVVTKIRATLSSTDGLGATLKPIEFRWVETDRFVGAEEYAKEYPNGKLQELHDYALYESRSYPFILAGGSSATKILLLWADGSGSDVKGLSSFKLSLTTETTCKNETVEGKYLNKQGLLKYQYTWFEEQD